MRIYFRIHERGSIKWPNRCLWCGAKVDKWLEVWKVTRYDFQYRIIWIEWASRTRSLCYPVCKKHSFIVRLYHPVWSFMLSWLVFIIELDLGVHHWVSLTLFVLLIVSIIYVRKKGLIIHRVNEFDTEISLPKNEYTKEFELLNNWKRADLRKFPFKRNIFIQEVNSREAYASIEENHFGEERELCPDESCTGIIEKGKCTVCGRRVK